MLGTLKSETAIGDFHFYSPWKVNQSGFSYKQKKLRTQAFNSTFIHSSKDNVQMCLINTISRTLFHFLIPAATWIWGMYLSRSSKGERANASHNVRNAAVCIVYVWMRGHQLLPGKQRLQSSPLGTYINVWPWDMLKSQKSLVQSTTAAFASTQHPVGSSWWPTAGSAPWRTGPFGPGFEQHWKNELREPALQEATCQPWQLNCHPQKLSLTGILL